MNIVTQKNSAASEEMSSSAEEMASQAEQLRDTISVFKTESNHLTRTNQSQNPSKTNGLNHMTNQMNFGNKSQSHRTKVEPRTSKVDIDLRSNNNNSEEFENY